MDDQFKFAFLKDVKQFLTLCFTQTFFSKSLVVFIPKLIMGEGGVNCSHQTFECSGGWSVGENDESQTFPTVLQSS